MNIELQVTSLELSKKLKENGYPQDRIWWWIYNKLQDKWKLSVTLSECVKSHPESWDYCVAPTCAELGEGLPIKVEHNKQEFYLHSELKQGKAYLYYRNYKGTHWFNFTTNLDIEANSRALMWLYLKEKGVIK